ncbi:MAG: hypothetical protein N2506_04140 [Dehalococcoidales bacterium]|nr:hypothetical protein [Dehalococcoidales bacterium]
MARKGLFIEWEYCTGCHACEVACKQEHNFSEGNCGVKVYEVVTTSPPDKVYVDFMPVVTRLCDLCAERTARGEMPACVKHCQALCMKYGTVEELAKALEKSPRSSVFVPH